MVLTMVSLVVQPGPPEVPFLTNLFWGRVPRLKSTSRKKVGSLNPNLSDLGEINFTIIHSKIAEECSSEFDLWRGSWSCFLASSGIQIFRPPGDSISYHRGFFRQQPFLWGFRIGACLIPTSELAFVWFRRFHLASEGH